MSEIVIWVVKIGMLVGLFVIGIYFLHFVERDIDFC